MRWLGLCAVGTLQRGERSCASKITELACEVLCMVIGSRPWAYGTAWAPMTGFKKLPFIFETLKFLSFLSPIQTLTIS